MLPLNFLPVPQPLAFSIYLDRSLLLRCLASSLYQLAFTSVFSLCLGLQPVASTSSLGGGLQSLFTKLCLIFCPKALCSLLSQSSATCCGRIASTSLQERGGECCRQSFPELKLFDTSSAWTLAPHMASQAASTLREILVFQRSGHLRVLKTNSPPTSSDDDSSLRKT